MWIYDYFKQNLDITVYECDSDKIDLVGVKDVYRYMLQLSDTNE